jgi:hypothetical protein
MSVRRVLFAVLWHCAVTVPTSNCDAGRRSACAPAYERARSCAGSSLPPLAFRMLSFPPRSPYVASQRPARALTVARRCEGWPAIDRDLSVHARRTPVVASPELVRSRRFARSPRRRRESHPRHAAAFPSIRSSNGAPRFARHCSTCSTGQPRYGALHQGHDGGPGAECSSQSSTFMEHPE